MLEAGMTPPTAAWRKGLVEDRSLSKKKKRRGETKELLAASDEAHGESELEGREGKDRKVKKKRKIDSEKILSVENHEALEVGVEEEAASLEAEENLKGHVADPHEGVVFKKIRKKPRWPKVDGKPVRPEMIGQGEVNQDSEVASKELGGTKVGKEMAFKGEGFHRTRGYGEPAEGSVGDIGVQSRKHEVKKKGRKKEKRRNRIGESADGSFAVNDTPENDDEGPSPLDKQQEGEYELKKVMVGGMPYSTTEDEIHEYFSECGTIAELDCMTFPDTGRFRGIAFVTFKTEAAAKRALALDGSDMGGRFLKIDLCKIKPRDATKKEMQARPPPQKHEGCKSAYIGNLAWDITEEDLRKFFRNCKVEAIRLAMDKESGEFRGFGHVDFADDKSLEAAMKLDQQEVLGRPLKIAYAVPKQADRVGGSGAICSLTGPSEKARTCHICGQEGHISYYCPLR